MVLSVNQLPNVEIVIAGVLGWLEPVITMAKFWPLQHHHAAAASHSYVIMIANPSYKLPTSKVNEEGSRKLKIPPILLSIHGDLVNNFRVNISETMSQWVMGF